MADIATVDPNEQGQVKQNFVIRQLTERHLGLEGTVGTLSSDLTSLTSIVTGLSARIIPFSASVSLSGTSPPYTYVPPSPNKYFLFQPSGIEYNQNSLWTSVVATGAAFVPPNGAKLVAMDAQIWATAGVAATGNFVAKWIKNATIDGSHFIVTGTDVKAGIGAVSDAGSGSAIMRASCYDVPSNNDYYNLFLFIDSTSLGVASVTIDVNAAHTYTQFTVLA